LSLAAFVLTLAACSEASCPSGSVESNGRCVDPDRASSMPGNDAQTDERPGDGATPVAPDTKDGAVASEDGAAPPPPPDAAVDRFCDSNVECPHADKSRCSPSGAECLPCAVSADCGHIPGKNVCNEGVCVVCKNGEEDGCGAFACDAARLTCSNAQKQNTAVACGACISDGNCKTGMVCGKQVSDDPGFTCMPAGACASPFLAASVPSVAGGTVAACSLKTTTCAAYLMWGKTCRFNFDCGDDGATCPWPAGAYQGSCTLPCNGNQDCPAGRVCSPPPTGPIIGGGTGRVCSG
jgi:hypothetical protein